MKFNDITMKPSKIVYKHIMRSGYEEVQGVRDILHVAMQGQDICFWYIHDNNAHVRTFKLVGTGFAFDGTYIGTVQDGPFVWHLVEI